MSAEISITLPAPPSANDYWRPAKGRGLVPSDEGLAFKSHVAGLFSVRGLQPVMGRVIFSVITHFSPRRDIGANVLKVLEDALNERGWLDDNQVDDVHVRRSVPWEPPGVEVRIQGERFATVVEAREYRDARAATRKKRRETVARNRSEKAMAGLLARAQAQTTTGPRLSLNVILPFQKGPPPMETHLSDCLVLYGKGASCTCGAVKR